jgi:hypothetical protein
MIGHSHVANIIMYLARLTSQTADNFCKILFIAVRQKCLVWRLYTTCIWPE